MPLSLANAEEKKRALRLAFCVAGIVSSLLCYGVLQERIMTQVRLVAACVRGSARATAAACLLLVLAPLALPPALPPFRGVLVTVVGTISLPHTLLPLAAVF